MQLVNYRQNAINHNLKNESFNSPSKNTLEKMIKGALLSYF